MGISGERRFIYRNLLKSNCFSKIGGTGSVEVRFIWHGFTKEGQLGFIFLDGKSNFHYTLKAGWAQWGLWQLGTHEG